MTKPPDNDVQEDGRFHTYETHRIPWYVRAGWIAFWVFAIWYTLAFVIPMIKNYF